MRRLKISLIILTLAWITGPNNIFSQEFRGQLSGWVTYQDFNAERSFQNGGFRYLPELNWTVADDPSNMVDLQISANLFAVHKAGTFDSHRNLYDNYAKEYDAEPYRWWIRYSTTNLEVRAGLQKINFGPAKLLRSLMWFDRLDPRDPLQLTKGVHGLLGRYIFNNNINIWAWGIYGQHETKGWEAVPSREGTGEFGGRVQYPLGFGDLGITVHTRHADADLELPSGLSGASHFSMNYRENRVALDGFFDVGVGLWFESALIIRNSGKTVLPLPDIDSYLTVGSDYTFAVGSGVHLMAEHLLRNSGDKPFDNSIRYQTSGVSASYPVTWLDNLAYYGFYNWDTELSYHYMSWRRTLNNWVLNLAVFGSSEGQSTGGLNQNLGEFGGDIGIQFMIIFNH